GPEGGVLGGSARPGHAAGTGDVPAAHRAFLRVIGHVQQFAGVLAGRAHVDQRLGLYPRVILAEAPLVGELETILRQGARSGELRDDVPAEILALALAGLADLAMAQHWASGDARPALHEIPETVLPLLLGPD